MNATARETAMDCRKIRSVTAVYVKFHGATNTKSTRLSAKFTDGEWKPEFTAWDYAWSTAKNYAEAAAVYAAQAGLKLSGTVVTMNDGNIFPVEPGNYE